jgi:hypothetical protein
MQLVRYYGAKIVMIFYAGTEQIAVDNFASGVYFIRVQAEENIRVLRFVKSDK